MYIERSTFGPRAGLGRLLNRSAEHIKLQNLVGSHLRIEDNAELEEVMEFTSQTENPHFPEVADLDPQEVHSKLAELTIIDVRRADEYTGPLGHIPGAQLLTLDQLPTKIENINTDKPIVFVCHSGARSAQATSFALENSFKAVYNMRGGMVLWNQLSLKVEK